MLPHFAARSCFRCTAISPVSKTKSFASQRFLARRTLIADLPPSGARTGSTGRPPPRQSSELINRRIPGSDRTAWDGLRSSSSTYVDVWCGIPGGWCFNWRRWPCRECCFRECRTVSAGYVRCLAKGGEILTRGRWRLLGSRVPFEGAQETEAGRNDDQDGQEGWFTTGIVSSAEDTGDRPASKPQFMMSPSRLGCPRSLRPAEMGNPG